MPSAAPAPRASIASRAPRPPAAPPAAPAAGPRLRAGLVHITDARPGLGRLPAPADGKDGAPRFVYRDADGRPVRDEAVLDRIRKLAIPPAWTDVWICPLAHGHVQATGRDARGRKQYRYHADWSRLRGDDKFARLLAFGRALPRLRARVQRDLAPAARGRPPVATRTLVLATIVRLLDTTFVRVGNEEYARANKSYGLTTLRRRHVGVEGATLHLRFRGKSGVEHRLAVEDRRVAAVVRRCQRLPGQELFRHEDDDGTLHPVGSGDVNDYLAGAAGEGFTAKDFRTWHGSVLALEWMRLACGDPAATAGGDDAETRRQRFSAQTVLAEVARRLGNTPAVCRKAYVHPAVLDLGSRLAADPSEMARFAAGIGDVQPARGLSASERRLLAFLRRPRQAQAAKAATAVPAGTARREAAAKAAG